MIQQRQAEKYINVIRMSLVSVLTATLVLMEWGLFSLSPPWLSLPPAILFGCWLYVASVQWALSRDVFPRYLPWVTTFTDLALIGIGFFFALGTPLREPSMISNSLSWGYGLLFLLILFSTLRERPVLTLVNGTLSAFIYAIDVYLVFPHEPYSGFWTDQILRMIFLFLAGSFSTFHARSIRKAFQRVATSETLRRESDARLKALVFHFPGVLFQAEVVGREFRVGYVSEGSRELLGFDSKELMAQPSLFFDRAPEEFASLLWKQIDQGGNGGAWNWEETFRYQSLLGKDTWLKMSATTHRSSPGSLMINGLITDVTEQRNTAEALREANEAKTDFLATMSHELRTPLNAILGNSEHLSRLAETPDDKRAFRDVQTSAETLLGLIEDILVFSRLEAGRLTAEMRLVDWRVQLESLFETFRPAVLMKGLDFEVQLPPSGARWILTDILRVRQILSNLVTNAVKFTPSGTVRIEVDLKTSVPNELEIAVIDSGIGIPLELQERIFEKFTQGEHGKNRTFGGLGLGLSIARSLTELLGGTLSVESQPGAGSTFRLRIPVQMEEDSQVVQHLGTEVFLDQTSPQVLLVEDNLTNQDVALRMLKKLGAKVDLAPSGREAVEMTSKRFYDLIFMDWQMPGMDGVEATSKIRNLPGGQDLIIVALSGHALPGDREFLLASGFDDYLSKPVRMDDFRNTLTKWVTTRQGIG